MGLSLPWLPCSTVSVSVRLYVFKHSGAVLQDGRIAGVGLLVGRNMDRGDAAKLPAEQLDLCEVEPLRQEEPGSSRFAHACRV